MTHLSPSSDDLNLENLKDVINWILIGSDGLQVIPGSASKSKCKWRKEFVAVTGLEPMLNDTPLALASVSFCSTTELHGNEKARTMTRTG